MDWILYVLLAAGVVFSIVWIFNFQKDLRLKWYAVIITGVLIAVFGVLSAVIFAKLENWISGTDGGNISIYGAIFLTPLYFLLGALIFKRPAGAFIDVLTVPIIIEAAFARVNCLIKGCCLGIPIPGTEMRWPTRELELVFDVVLIVILLRKTAKKQFTGTNYPIYLLSYGIFRFIIQWFREPGFTVGPLGLSHIWSILSILTGLCLIILLNKTNTKTKTKKAVSKK